MNLSKESDFYAPLTIHHNSMPFNNVIKLYEHSPPIYGAKINSLQRSSKSPLVQRNEPSNGKDKIYKMESSSMHDYSWLH